MANRLSPLYANKGFRRALFLGLAVFTLIPALYAVSPPALWAGPLNGWQFSNPLPQGNDLNGVYALDETHLIAVGDNGAIIQYSQGGDAKAMNQNTSLDFYGTWGSAKNNWFAVGEKGLIMHFDGQSWTTMNSGVTVDLNDVWGSDANNVFAVGTGGMILHYDGTSWSQMAVVTTQDLNCVSGTGPYDVFFGGNSGTILHYDGVFISPMATGEVIHFYDIWAGSSVNVWAVGNGVITRYDGATWNPVLHTIWGDIVSVCGSGSGNTVQVANQLGEIYEYQSGGWSTQWASNHAVGAKVNDMWMKPGDWTMAFAVGDGGTLFKYNHFPPRNYDPLILPEKDVNDIHGVSSDKMFAAGDDGLALAYNSTYAMWQEISAMSGLTTKDLLAVHAQNGFTHFVGEQGTLIGYDGTSAVAYSSSYTGNVNDVCAVTINEAYAVGTGGAVLKFNGGSWSQVQGGTFTSFNGVACVGTGDIYVVGDTGQFTRYTNNIPTHFLSVTTQGLNAVWAASAADAVAVGDNGTIVWLDAAGLRTVSSPVTVNLTGVWGTSMNDIFACGENGTVIHWDGASWQAADSATDKNLAGAWVSPDGHAFAAGETGTILHWGIPAAPTFTLIILGNTVSGMWNQTAWAQGYTLYFAPYPAGFPIYSAPMGAALSISVTLPSSAACYAAVTAYNGAGESPYSNIANFTVP